MPATTASLRLPFHQSLLARKKQSVLFVLCAQSMFVCILRMGKGIHKRNEETNERPLAKHQAAGGPCAPALQGAARLVRRSGRRGGRAPGDFRPLLALLGPRLRDCQTWAVRHAHRGGPAPDFQPRHRRAHQRAHEHLPAPRRHGVPRALGCGQELFVLLPRLGVPLHGQAARAAGPGLVCAGLQRARRRRPDARAAPRGVPRLSLRLVRQGHRRSAHLPGPGARIHRPRGRPI